MVSRFWVFGVASSRFPQYARGPACCNKSGQILQGIHTTMQKSGFEYLVALLVLACFPSSGCHTSRPVYPALGEVHASCYPVLRVLVIDSTTGIPLGDAIGLVRDGAYADSLTPKRYSGGTLAEYWAAARRPGVYSLEVQHEGYLTWYREGLSTEPCPLSDPPSITARLVPANVPAN